MEEKVYFKNSKGDKLCGVLSSVTGDKSKPMIILCHGFSSSKDSNTYILFEKRFNDKGFSTFRFDFYGHGESEGKFEDITVSEAVDDTISAIKFLKGREHIKFGLIGSSFGGMTALLTAAKSKHLSVLGLRAPVSDYLKHLIARYTEVGIEDWKKTGFTYYVRAETGEKLRLNYSFFEDASKIDGYKNAKKIMTPTIIVHGGNDFTVPIEQSVKCCENIKDCKLHILPKANHHFSSTEDYEKCINLIVDFFVEKLNQ